jgi:hypothetical protein
MLVVACKLPHGLTIKHAGRTINLNGPNEGVDPLNPGPNRTRDDTATRSGGFGLTKLDDKDAEAFEAWTKAVTTRPDGSKLPEAEAFPALDNGSILMFGSLDEAREETTMLGESVKTGVEGIDPTSDREMKDGGLETLAKE